MSWRPPSGARVDRESLVERHGRELVLGTRAPRPRAGWPPCRCRPCARRAGEPPPVPPSKLLDVAGVHQVARARPARRPAASPGRARPCRPAASPRRGVSAYPPARARGPPTITSPRPDRARGTPERGHRCLSLRRSRGTIRPAQSSRSRRGRRGRMERPGDDGASMTCCSVRSAVTSSAAETSSSPFTTRALGSPLMIVSASARSLLVERVAAGLDKPS